MEITSFLRAGFALIIVLGLIGFIAYLARRFGLAGNGVPGRGERRLSLVETMTLDPKRRILLIKCDQAEHLILLGPNSETVLSGAAPTRIATPDAPPVPSVEDAQPPMSPATLRGPLRSGAQPQEHKPQPQTQPDDGRREPQLPPPYRPHETQ